MMPHVAEKPSVATATEEVSENKRAADRAVAGLIRDLFGAQAAQVDAPPKEESSAQPLPEGMSVVAEPRKEHAGEEDAEISAVSEVRETEEETASVPPIPVIPEGEPLTLKQEVDTSKEAFRLFLDLEYEQELGESVGFDEIREHHEKAINNKKSKKEQKKRTEGSEEFEDQDQVPEMHRRYAQKRTAWIVRLALSFVCFVLILLYENAEGVAGMLGGPFDGEAYPAFYILIGLQLLVFSAALCYRPLCEGFVHLWRFSPVDHSAHSALLLVTVIYHTVLIFLPLEGYPVLYLSPAALALTLLAASELLNLFRESFAFDIISPRRQKYAIIPRVSAGGEQSSARARLARSESEGCSWYVRPVGFVRNYVHNTSHHAARHRNLGAHFLLCMGLGGIVCLLAFAGGGDVSHSVSFFFVTVVCCAPIISALLTSLPMFFAACFRLRGRGAIIGEAPLEQFAPHDTLVLPDNDLFVGMTHERFRLTDMCDAHRVTLLLRALLEKVQSPLAATFAVEAESRIGTADLTLTHLGEQGASAKWQGDGAVIALGTAAYMKERGLTVPAVSEEEAQISPLYVAVDGSVCATFLVRYTPSADLEQLCRELQHFGIRVVIRSKDPCVRADVFASLFPSCKGIAVQKPDANELDLRTNSVDTALVAVGSAKEVARTLLTCRRICRVGTWGKILQLFVMLGGGALSVLLALLGYLPSALYATLWGLLWSGTYALISYLYLRRPTDDI